MPTRKKHLPRPDEVPLKQFMQQQARLHGIGITAVHNRITRGRHYPDLKLRRVNSRVVYVKNKP